MQNDVIGALPTGGPADSPLLRNLIIKRMVYNIQSTEDPQDFEALDPDTGAITEVIQWNGTFFFLDPNDTTSAHDGVTVIRTLDDYRYKIEDVDYRIRSVLSDTVTYPPGSPANGDAYLVPAGATGSWSSHQDDIAIYTRNGWRFEVPGIGKWLLIEDVDGFKRYTASGWQYGPGARSFDDDSIPLSAALGFGERIIVESQTTNTPPTATKGLRYIVGPAPTGVWLGKAKQIAICEVAGVWTFYPPGNGWAAYDKSANASFTFNGTAWVSSQGVWLRRLTSGVITATISTYAGTGNYSYSATVAPTTATNHAVDNDAVVTHTALKVGAPIRITYAGDLLNSGTSQVLALYRDNESTAINWFLAPAIGLTGNASATFEFLSTDTNEHTYKVRWQKTGGADPTIARRRMTLEEGS